MAIRSGTITEGGLKIKWNETATGISYSNGKVAVPSVQNMDAKIAYKTATSVVVPPKEPPVVIPPTVPQQPDTKLRSITAKELEKAVLSNERVQLIKGTYNGQIWGTQLNNTFLDLSLGVFSGNIPAFEFRGDCSGAHIKGGLFQNCDKLFILGNEVTTRGFTIDGITAINTKQIFGSYGYFDGTLNNKLIGFKMIGCTLKDSPDVGTLVWLQCAEDFELSGNVIDNINGNLNNHNGLFMLGGNGVLKGNRCTNHQGDLLRATPYQVEGTGKQLVIENNIVWNSRKYGAFEVKTNDVSGFKAFKPCDVAIRNNTVGRLNTSKDWDAKLVDVYDTFGTVTVERNLGFDLFQTKAGKITDLINYASVTDATKIVKGGDLYFDTWEQAVGNLTTFRSLHPGIGAI